MATIAVLKTEYYYHVTDSLGNYIGELKNVLSEFNYNQQIATAFAQTQILVGTQADTAQGVISPLLDENGAPLLDETGAQLFDEGPDDAVGDGTIIANNNLITIVEVSQYHPQGVTVFHGYISKWKTIFGGDNNILITCISNGNDLNQYIISSIQAIDEESLAVDTNINIKNGISQYCYIPFTPSGGVTNITQVALHMAAVSGTVNAIVMVYASSSLITNISRMLSGNTPDAQETLPVSSLQDYIFTVPFDFPSPVHPIIVVKCNDANGLTLYGTGTFSGSGSSYSAYHITYYVAGESAAEYSLQDPSNIATLIMQQYQNQGGLIGVGSGFALTGTTTQYAFKVQTVLQGIQTLLGLAPANWYWYVDPSNDTLVFAKSNTVADFTLIKGKHIQDLEIEATKENIKNVAYFTGGDDGTNTNTNIYVKETAPLGSNRVGMVQLADNRVNSTNGGVTVARQIADLYMASNSAETYITTVTILGSTMDISSINLGMMCGFSGFGNFADNLLLQVVGISYAPDQVQLQLGTLPVRLNRQLQAINTQINQQYTIDNPSSPS